MQVLSCPLHLAGIQALVVQAQIADFRGSILTEISLEKDKTGQQRIIPAAAGGLVRFFDAVYILLHFHALAGKVRPDFLRARFCTGQQCAELALKRIFRQSFVDCNSS